MPRGKKCPECGKPYIHFDLHWNICPKNTEVTDNADTQDGSANAKPLRELASPSNSKSEDTPTLPSDSMHEPLSDNPSPSKGLLKATEPPQENCGEPHTDEDYGLMNCNLLKGHEGEHCTILVGASQDSPLGQVTSLDDIHAIMFQPSHAVIYPETEAEEDYPVARRVLAWHKAEIAKLFEQIRSEVLGDIEEKFINSDIDSFRQFQREALTRLEGTDE